MIRRLQPPLVSCAACGPPLAADVRAPCRAIRLGIRLYISQILEAESTLARGDHIVEEMRREARERSKAGEQEDGR